MVERPVGPERVSLGTNFINVRLVISQEDYKVERILELLLSSWNNGIRAFLPLAAAKLIGNIVNAAQHANWLRWSLHHNIHEIKSLLQKIHHHLAKNQDIQNLLVERDKGWLDLHTKKMQSASSITFLSQARSEKKKSMRLSLTISERKSNS